MNIKNVILFLSINFYPLVLFADFSAIIVEPNIDVSRSCQKLFNKPSSSKVSQTERAVRVRRCKLSISPYIVSDCLIDSQVSCLSYTLKSFAIKRKRKKSGFNNSFSHTKQLDFSEVTEIKKLTIRLKPRDMNSFDLIIPEINPASIDKRVDFPWDYTAPEQSEPCIETRRKIGEEYNLVSYCEDDSDCGQFIERTSCGCSNNLVANKDANLDSFYKLLDLGINNSCNFLDFTISTCECEEFKGFICKNSRCEVADVSI